MGESEDGGLVGEDFRMKLRSNTTRSYQKSDPDHMGVKTHKMGYGAHNTPESRDRQPLCWIKVGIHYRLLTNRRTRGHQERVDVHRRRMCTRSVVGPGLVSPGETVSDLAKTYVEREETKNRDV